MGSDSVSLRTRLRKLTPALRWVCLAIGVAWAIGQFLREMTTVTFLLYGIPSLGLLFVASIGVSVSVKPWRPRWCAAFGVLLAAGFLTFGFQENQWGGKAAPDAEGWTVVHWNLNRDHFSWESKVEVVAEQRPDIAVLSECPKTRDPGDFSAAIGEGWRVNRMATMAIVVRGRILKTEWIEQTMALKACLADLYIDGQSVRVLAVDVTSSPWKARGPILGRVQEAIARYQPDLVLGDFNTQRRAYGLQRVPDGYRHAYEEVGSGWGYTWPVPAPMWAIDQFIAGPRIQLLSYELDSTLLSDHRLQKARIVLISSN